MTDQFHDNSPNISQGVSTDFVSELSETLGYIKDCFQELCTGWSNTDATGMTIDKPYFKTASPSSSTNETFTGLTAGSFYRLIYVLNISNYTAWMRFGNEDGIDTDLVYDYGYVQDDVSPITGNDTSKITLGSGVNAVYHFGSVDFNTVSGDDTMIVGKAFKIHTKSSGSPTTFKIGFSYEGSKTVDRVQIYPSGSTMTGSIRLIEMK